MKSDRFTDSVSPVLQSISTVMGPTMRASRMLGGVFIKALQGYRRWKTYPPLNLREKTSLRASEELSAALSFPFCPLPCRFLL